MFTDLLSQLIHKLMYVLNCMPYLCNAYKLFTGVSPKMKFMFHL